jgi:3-oxoacyl-[acyl-carrier protein] reductase
LTRRGYRVAITHRPGTPPSPETLARFGPEPDARPLAIAADHAAAGHSEAAVRAAEASFGRLDVLVHAVGPIVVKRFANLTMGDYRMLVDANLGSAVETAFAILPGMRERGFGRMIFFGMNGSQTTLPARGMSLYGAAKAGVVTFARTLALEEAKFGITVNVVEPGDIRQKTVDREGARGIPANNPTGHAGSWEDIAYAVGALVADEAEFINGQVLGVNGGLVEPHE